MEYPFCKKSEIASFLGYSPHTLKVLRRREDWLEGIHYVRLNSRTIRYNRELCLNWLANRDEPDLHQQAIDQYVEWLASKKPMKRKSPA